MNKGFQGGSTLEAFLCGQPINVAADFSAHTKAHAILSRPQFFDKPHFFFVT